MPRTEQASAGARLKLWLGLSLALSSVATIGWHGFESARSGQLVQTTDISQQIKTIAAGRGPHASDDAIEDAYLTVELTPADNPPFG